MDRSIKEILKDRVKHPILGGFIFSFLLVNFDVIYLLLMNSIYHSNPSHSLSLFNSSFKMDIYYRFVLPFSIAMAGSILIPIVDAGYKTFLVFIASLRDRWSKRAMHYDYDIMISDLNIDIRRLASINQTLSSNLSKIIESVLINFNLRMDIYRIYKCSKKINIGSIVSIRHPGILELPNLQNKRNLYGKVIWTNKKIALVEKIADFKDFYQSKIFDNKVDPDKFIKENELADGQNFYLTLNPETTVISLDLKNTESDNKVVLGYFNIQNDGIPKFTKSLRGDPDYSEKDYKNISDPELFI